MSTPTSFSACDLPSPWFGLPSLQDVRERIETLLPEVLVGGEPLGGLAQRFGVERQAMLPTAHLSSQQARALQHPQMLRDRVQRHREGLGQVGDAGVAASETGEDRAS